MELDAKIESLLYFKAEPVAISSICKILGVNESEVVEAIKILKEKKVGTGLAIVEADNEIALTTSSEASEFIEAIRKEELNKDLSKASLETLAIILYKDGATRAEIDYIRGVNSSFILRNLLVRGLVKKQEDPKDARRLIYKATIETLQFLGAENIENIPKYHEVRSQLEEAINNKPNE